MGISDQIVEEIRARGDLVEIVAETTTLKRSGRSFRGPCPLHGGEGPNFSVDPARNVFKCFVCGESGDLFSFPMKHFGMSFVEAVRWVAVRVGIEIPEEDRSRPEDDPHARYHEANAFAASWFRARLIDDKEGRDARQYLLSRGITPEICERFGIGWAPVAWSALADAAATHGIKREILLEVGLVKQAVKSAREPYDTFRGRIIFPIEDLSGKVVAFGGRVIGTVEAHVPKYLNSPETPVYHKGDLLYGIRWSRGAIRKEEAAMVVEGYMDYVSLAAHGVENIVAALGTAFTPQQAALIARYAPRVVLLYDSDKAGLKATFRSGDELLRAGVEVMVATLPEGEDPDSIVRRGGGTALRKYVHDAVDVLERKIQILERRDFFSSIAGKRRAVDALLPTVRAASDEVLRGLYVDRIAERTGIPKPTIEKEVGEADPRTRLRAGPESRAPQAKQSVSPRQPAVGPAPRLGAERNLILLLLRDEQWIEKAAERLGPDDIIDPAYREIYQELLHLQAEGGRSEGAGWLLALSDEVAVRAQELLGDPEGANIAQPERFFDENLRDIEVRNQRERLTRIERELQSAPEVRQGELLGEMIELRRSLERAGVVMKVNHARRTDRSGPA